MYGSLVTESLGQSLTLLLLEGTSVALANGTFGENDAFSKGGRLLINTGLDAAASI